MSASRPQYANSKNDEKHTLHWAERLARLTDPAEDKIKELGNDEYTRTRSERVKYYLQKELERRKDRWDVVIPLFVFDVLLQSSGELYVSFKDEFVSWVRNYLKKQQRQHQRSDKRTSNSRWIEYIHRLEKSWGANKSGLKRPHSSIADTSSSRNNNSDKRSATGMGLDKEERMKTEPTTNHIQTFTNIPVPQSTTNLPPAAPVQRASDPRLTAARFLLSTPTTVEVQEPPFKRQAVAPQDHIYTFSPYPQHPQVQPQVQPHSHPFLSSLPQPHPQLNLPLHPPACNLSSAPPPTHTNMFFPPPVSMNPLFAPLPPTHPHPLSHPPYPSPVPHAVPVDATATAAPITTIPNSDELALLLNTLNAIAPHLSAPQTSPSLPSSTFSDPSPKQEHAKPEPFYPRSAKEAFAPERMTKPIDDVVADLFRPCARCEHCALRFNTSDELQTHLTWHFMNNERDAKRLQSKEGFSRAFFLPQSEWIKYQETIKTLKQQQLERQEARRRKQNTSDQEKAANQRQWVPADDVQSICPICQVAFDHQFDSETDTWMYVQATIFQSDPSSPFYHRILHTDCAQVLYPKEDDCVVES